SSILAHRRTRSHGRSPPWMARESVGLSRRTCLGIMSGWKARPKALHTRVAHIPAGIVRILTRRASEGIAWAAAPRPRRRPSLARRVSLAHAPLIREPTYLKEIGRRLV